MICGEWGRGFAWLGGHVGCYMLTGISAIAESDTLVLMGIAGLLAIDICSIVDGVRVAKVKNMYMEDLRRSGYYGLDVDIMFFPIVRPATGKLRQIGGMQP